MVKRPFYSSLSPLIAQVFAWVGFAVAVIWIYSIANEIVSLLQVCMCVCARVCVCACACVCVCLGVLLPVKLGCVVLLQAFGVVIKLSDGILGLTLLAWGNSIGGEC